MRTFASSGGGHGEEVVHEGLKLHATGGWHKAVGEALSGLMWFWVFYRFYHDYEGFLFGHVGHHEHMLHEEDEHH
jgi:NADH dehydrogenase (ubiquinone) 1 beta subcomplex subunit 2